MSYFVTVTFDIRDAGVSPYRNDVYRRINAELDEVDFSKTCTGKKKVKWKLPSNTYVAEFDGDQDASSSSGIVKFVSSQLDRIFADYEVHGRYFIAVGGKWAWKGKSF